MKSFIFAAIALLFTATSTTIQAQSDVKVDVLAKAAKSSILRRAIR
jgi:hypothetical protein